ncbi:MAG TPA: hypothetical protein VK483_16595 [Chitinophagaceae bacterium]|nr:hypothetical protein [Chitinophagaceae bacterium]
MNKYGRQHGSGNTSKGIYWILFAGAAALGIYKIVLYVRKVNEVHEIEMEEKKYNKSGPYIIITDSTGKQDTQLMQDGYLYYDPATDTIKKPSLKDSFK